MPPFERQLADLAPTQPPSTADDTQGVNDAMTSLLFLFALQVWRAAPRSALERLLATWPRDYVASAKA